MQRREWLGAALLACAMPKAWAQSSTWPDRPIRLVVPFPPGGLIDRMARLLGPRLAQSLGQSVVVENKPGAGGNVGAADVARASADGYTLLMASPPLTISPAIYPSLPYRLEQLTPVALLGRVQNVMLVRADSPVKSVADLTELAKSRPSELNYASNGNGTSLHLCMELYKTLSGVDITHVPYRGAAAATTALLAGEVDVMFDNLPAALGHLQAGTIRALAVTAAERSESLPDVPTMIEAGVAGFDVSAWFGVAVPADTPAAVTDRLGRELAGIMADPEVEQTLREQAAERYVLQEDALARFWAEDAARWREVAAEARITIE